MGKRKLTEEEKHTRRKEQQKEWVRKKRSKLGEAELQERRRKDRERYKAKKEAGLIKSIKDMTPRAQRQIRKGWRERNQKHREKIKQMKENENRVIDETPPASPAPQSSRSSRSRSVAGRRIVDRNRKRVKRENVYLRQKVLLLENRLARYRMRMLRKEKRSNKISVNVPDKVQNKKRKKLLDLKEAVTRFLERDDVSRLTAGKKETITRKKQKKQIRLLSDTMLNLYKKFKEEIKIKMSYALFCRNRPFWVIIPDSKKRNTCLCSVHANMEYIVTALKRAKVLIASTPTELVKKCCCNDRLQVKCLRRECSDCKNKTMSVNEYNPSTSITCDRWVSKKTPIIIKNETKLCQRTIKESIITTNSGLLTILKEKLPAFMNHIANIMNQYRTVTKIKKTLAKDEVLLHIDFAENYMCKYAEEVQSAHFGASKPQISLHTSVLYMHDQEPEPIQGLCSISENLRHDPILICAHLKPVMDYIKEKCPEVKTIHFQSDGPTTQYKNKSMFYLLAKYIGLELGVDSIQWHFSESGHGKGAPDGIGGCVKRTADAQVAAGNDVSTYESLVKCLQDNCKGVRIFPIDNTHVDYITELLNKNTTPTFKGTLAIRQLTWNKTNPDKIHARSLSCDSCKSDQICSHYEIGIIYLSYKTNNSDEAQVSSHASQPIEAPEEDCVSLVGKPSPLEISSPVHSPRKALRELKGINFYKTCYGSDSENETTEFRKTSTRHNDEENHCSDGVKYSDDETIF